MKTHSKLPYRSRGFTAAELGRLAAICLIAIVTLGRAAQTRPAPAPATPPVTQELQFVKSVFVATPGPGFGTDPFFPKTTRFHHVRPTTTTETPGPVSFLKLNGISGTKNHRLAIINYKTFEAGEEGEIKINGVSFRVKCGEIRDDGVSVLVNGQPQKLTLPK